MTRGAVVSCLAIVVHAVALIGAQMATVDRVQSPGWWPTKGTAPRADYIGAAACAECHPSQSRSQPTTAMARTAMRARDSAVLREHRRLSMTSGAYHYEIVTTDEGSVYSVKDGSRAADASLVWAFGDGKTGQSFLFEKDGALHEARVSYYETGHALDFTPGRRLEAPRDLDEAMARRISDLELRRCFACHATAPVAGGTLDLAAAIPGIGCEACHGPGRSHVEAMHDRRMAEGRKAILNPAKLPPAESVDFCGACHATFWDITLANEKGNTALRSEPFRLASSRCWQTRDARLRCTACHNPHQPLVRDVGAYDSKCLACHTAPAGRVCTVGTARCAGCHMPKFEVPELHRSFTDHFIRIVRER